MRKLNNVFYLWLVGIALLSYVLHEAAHWLAGAAFGADMHFGLNRVKLLSPLLPWQKAVMDAAGPVFTICQAFVALGFVLRTGSHKAFGFLYIAAFMRAVAGLVSLANPNDEARLSMYFGLGKWTLPVIVAALLIALVWKGSRRLQLGWKDQLLCYLAASLIMSAIVGFDQVFL